MSSDRATWRSWSTTSSTLRGEQGCVLEVFNAVGESIAVVVVPESDIEELRADEVLAVRPLARAD